MLIPGRQWVLRVLLLATLIAGPIRAENRAAEKLAIPDVQLLDQDGKSVRFSGLLKGKVVAINFMFTNCMAVCPHQAEGISKVFNRLADRLGENFRFISITVDPETDQPPQLKAWAERYHIQVPWTLVTGSRPQIDKLLAALGAFTESEHIRKSGVWGRFSYNKADHSRTVLIGDEARGLWVRGPVNELAELLERLVIHPAASPSIAHHPGTRPGN